MELIILEEYMKLNNIRKLNIEEEILLEELVHRSIKVISPDWKNGLLVDVCPRIALLEHGVIIRDIINEDNSAEKELEDYFNVEEE